jgi:short-subunit dehydrogenase
MHIAYVNILKYFMATALPSGKIERNYFYNKNIWITGASSGIGEQLAYDLSKLGARIILSSRRKSALEEVKNRCEGYPNKIIIVPLDLSEHQSISPKAQQVLKEIGKIDILINNGGISQRAKAIDCDLDVDKQIMNVNFFGTVAMTKAILPSMIRHQLGQIVTITSVSGKVGVPERSAYCASKFACHGFFDALRAEVAEHDIHVMTVCPAYVKTKIAQNALRKNSKTSTKLDPNIENGMSTEYVSKHILKGIRKRREEIYIGKKEVLGIYLMRLFPKWFFLIAKRLNTK